MKSKNNIPAIIVAHEHEGVRQVIVEICRAAGCVARGVSSGPVLAEYLDIMKTDIVILSDRLPFMTVEDLRDDYPEIKQIKVMTHNLDKNYQQELLELGADSVMARPVNVEHIVNELMAFGTTGESSDSEQE